MPSFARPLPPYMQAAQVLRDEIVSGYLKPGARVPSHRALQQRFGIASTTSRNTVEVLRAEGLLRTVPGRGTFVVDILPPDCEPQARADPPELVDLVRELSAQISTLNQRVSTLETRLHRVGSALTKQ